VITLGGWEIPSKNKACRDERKGKRSGDGSFHTHQSTRVTRFWFKHTATYTWDGKAKWHHEIKNDMIWWNHGFSQYCFSHLIWRILGSLRKFVKVVSICSAAGCYIVTTIFDIVVPLNNPKISCCTIGCFFTCSAHPKVRKHNKQMLFALASSRIRLKRWTQCVNNCEIFYRWSGLGLCFGKQPMIRSCDHDEIQEYVLTGCI